MPTVSEIMATDLVSIPPTATIAEAATVMGGRRVGSALVMDEDRLLGIFTERDTVRALSQDFDAPGHPVSDWMTRDPVCVGPDTSVDDALGLMLQRGFRHLPVMEGERVVGMVSIRDLSRSERQQLGG
jgi:CBS domain-containing protein